MPAHGLRWSMIDQFGRDIHYLRLSLTERCTLKCAYCRADEGQCPKQAELRCEQFAQIVRACAALGIRKVRLTGGEPLLRRDIVEIVEACAAAPGIEEITLTTNAQQLDGRAERLKRAGLTRMNISIDSLDPEKFRRMTGGGEVRRVFDAVDEALACGLLPVKLNAVVVRGENDDEIDDFIELTRTRPIEVRFIELMPLGRLGEDPRRRVPSGELIGARPQLRPVPPAYPGQPSTDYKIDGYQGKVGFISAVSHKFCGDCNRIRILSDGKLRPCLGNNAEISLLPALEQGEAALTAAIREAIYNKPRAHHFEENWKTRRNMTRIGG